MGLAIDWYGSIIEVTSPTTDVDAQTLHDFIEDEMAAPVGLQHSAILKPEGKIEDEANPGIFSQIILIFNNPWQIQFWSGSGYTRIYGGKLTSVRPDNQVVKATGGAGDITVLESPVDGLTVATAGLLQQSDLDALSDAVWDEILTGATHNIPSSAGRRLRQLGDTISSSVNDGAATATAFVTNLSETRDDFYNDQYIRFTSDNLAGQVRIVLDYDGGTKTITVSEPFYEAPDDTSEFDLLPVHVHPIKQVGEQVWLELDAPPSAALAATNLATAKDTMFIGTVDDTAFAPTATEFEASDINFSIDDILKSGVVFFTAGALRGERTDITSYSLVGGRGHFTVTAMPQAAASGDLFVIG